jgi:hypothetical protein
MDTDAKGSSEALLLEDLCLLDSRPLSAHPSYHAIKSVLGPANGSSCLGSSGAGSSVAEAPAAAPAAAEDRVPDTPAASEGEAGEGEEAGAAPAGSDAQREQRALGPPVWAAGPSCMLCNLATVPPG